MLREVPEDSKVAHVWDGVDFVFAPDQWAALQLLATATPRPGRAIARPQFWVGLRGGVTALTGVVTLTPKTSMLEFGGGTGGVFAQCPAAAVLEGGSVPTPRPPDAVGIPRRHVAALGGVLMAFAGLMESMAGGDGDCKKESADLGVAWRVFQRCVRAQQHQVPAEWQGDSAALPPTLPVTFLLALDPILLKTGSADSELHPDVDISGATRLVWEVGDVDADASREARAGPRRPTSPPSRSKRGKEGTRRTPHPFAFTIFQ